MSGEKGSGEIRCWREIGISGDLSCPKLVDIIHCRNCEEYNRAGRRLFDREIPEGFLDEWTKNIAGIKGADIEETLSVIVFRVNSEWLALKTVCLEEAAAIRPVHHVPLRTNNIFKGVVNVNGELLLCMSVADLLDYAIEGQAGQPAERVFQRMLVVRIESERYVFPVDEVLGIYRVCLSAMGEPPATMAKSPTSLIKGIFNLEERRIGLVDEDGLRRTLKRSLLS
ncbi:MAG TPA: chemotaxis protein CheW [Syntrophorhabdaceae bacterium]|jgi:chemotaxis-related protein WspD